MVGELIRTRRRALGWSQEVLAEKMGWQQTYLSRVERGEIEVPQRATLERLSDLLDVSLQEFYTAAGMFEGLPDSPPPIPVNSDPDDEDEYIPDDEIVAYVKSRPGKFFQREIAILERDLGPADFIEQCRDIFAAWKSNSRLAVRSARRGR